MDKRINFLNKLKKRLNSYVISDSKKKNSLHQKKTTITSHSILQAQMLNENVQSGMALGEINFNSSSVYAEFSKDGTLN